VVTHDHELAAAIGVVARTAHALSQGGPRLAEAFEVYAEIVVAAGTQIANGVSLDEIVRRIRAEHE
jgi:hypothetical protein